MNRHVSRRWLVGLVFWWPWTVSMAIWIGALVLLGLGVLPDLMAALSTVGMVGVIVASNHFSRVRGPNVFGTKVPRHPRGTLSGKTAIIGLLAALGLGIPLMVAAIVTR